MHNRSHTPVDNRSKFISISAIGRQHQPEHQHNNTRSLLVPIALIFIRFYFALYLYPQSIDISTFLSKIDVYLLICSGCLFCLFIAQFIALYSFHLALSLVFRLLILIFVRVVFFLLLLLLLRCCYCPPVKLIPLARFVQNTATNATAKRKWE